MKKTLAKVRRQELLDEYIAESGKIGYALLWLIGVPLPVLLVLYVFFK